MADIEITDEASLEAWLKTRPRRDAEIIAFRAAARVFPLWGRALEEDALMSISALPVLRPLLNTFLSSLVVTLTPDGVARNANSYLEGLLERYWIATNSNLQNSRGIATDAAATAIWAKDSWAIPVVSAALFAAEDAKTSLSVAIHADSSVISYSSAWSVIKKDVHALMAGSFAAPLWPTAAPDWFTKADLETRAIWAKDPATWAFWEKWWDGVISGDMPFSPELLRDVALIEDDIWQAGPKAVAERINLLIQRNALQREAAAINARLMEFISFNEGLGANLHNQPPEDELSPVKLRAALGEISQALKEIEVALDGPEILPEVVAGLGQRLKDLWDGLSAKVKVGIVGLTFVATSISQGFLGSVGDDIHELVKRNIDIPSFSRRLLDFGKELEKPRNPAPVFPPRPPVDL